MKILDLEGKEKGTVNLPKQFSEEIRPDLVKLAVLAIQSHKRQKYGASPEAGKRASADVSKRRRKYRGTYGIGQSRTPRKVMSRSGMRLNFTGAFAPQTVGGRRAHPPKVEKEWKKKVNDKERKKAIRSALSATVVKELVSKRGHKISDNYPFVLDSKVESLSKTKEVLKTLTAVKLDQELARVRIKKVRAGKGKLRGRKYRKKVGPLIVVGDKCNLMDCKNIPGVDIELVNNINAELLAPGCDLGRLTIFTDKALAKLENNKLFK